MERARALHIVTYVDRAGDGRRDPLAFGTVELTKTMEDSPTVKASLGTVPQYHCDGFGEDTDKCHEAHGQSGERIIARARPDGKVAVTWRRYHPRIAHGVVRPGNNFEAVDPTFGNRITVEVREIDYSGKAEGGKNTIPEAEVAQLDKQLALEQKRFAPERQLAQQVRNFRNLIVDQNRAHIDEQLAPLDALVSPEDYRPIRDRFLELLEQEAMRINGVFVDAIRDENKPAANALQQPIQAGTQAANEIMAQLPAAVEQARQLAEVRQKLSEGREQLAIELELVRKLDSRPAKTLLARVDALIDKAFPANAEKMAELTQSHAEVMPAVEAMRADLAEETQRLRAEKASFETRIDSLGAWDGTNQGHWQTFIRRGQGYPGFGVKYWSESFEKLAPQVAEAAGDKLEGLDFREAKDVAKVVAREKKIAAILNPFFETLSKEMARRSEGTGRTIMLANGELTLPEVSIRVSKVEGEQITAEVDARNLDRYGMIIEVRAANNVRIQLPLASEGDSVRAQLQNAASPFSVSINSVATGPIEDLAAVQMQAVKVAFAPVEAFLPGAHVYVPVKSAEIRADAKAAAAGIDLRLPQNVVADPPSLPGVTAKGAKWS